jgi:hypothetical protein
MKNQLTVFNAAKALEYVEQAKILLEKAKTVGEIKAIHTNAEALKAPQQPSIVISSSR